jgi:hypothetical protein
MTVRFTCNQIMVPYMRVKVQYRYLCDTLFNIGVGKGQEIFVMISRYTQAEYN